LTIGFWSCETPLTPSSQVCQLMLISHEGPSILSRDDLKRLLMFGTSSRYEEFNFQVVKLAIDYIRP